MTYKKIAYSEQDMLAHVSQLIEDGFTSFTVTAEAGKWVILANGNDAKARELNDSDEVAGFADEVEKTVAFFIEELRRDEIHVQMLVEKGENDYVICWLENHQKQTVAGIDYSIDTGELNLVLYTTAFPSFLLDELTGYYECVEVFEVNDDEFGYDFSVDSLDDVYGILRTLHLFLT